MLKIILLITIAAFSIGMINAYASDEYSFGVRMIPEKLIENSEGILQVYALHNNHVYPKKIENLASSSTSSSIVQVTGMENGSNDIITNIKLRSASQGNAKIELGAPGFTSVEIPITVYGNANYPTKLLVKSTPSTFLINRPSVGYFTVELTNNDGTPVTTKNDIPIDLTVTDNRVLALSDNSITIKAGEYYAYAKFSIKQIGSTQIFASSKSFQSASSTITVSAGGSPSVQMYVYPQKINNYAASTSYVIAQLKDSNGILTPAREDIVIPVRFVDPKANLTNSSPVINNIESNVPITIKKGSYWGYTTAAVKVGVNGTYNAFISPPNGYSSSGQSQLTTFTTKLFDDKSARLDVLPILATGKDELIGIVHLEDKSGNPIIASHDMQIEIDSSDPNTVAVDKVIMNKGSGVAPVFGKVGINTASSVSLHVVTYNDQTVTPTISVPASNSLNLVADPLVSQILDHSTFPIVSYLKDSSAPAYFPSDSILNVLPSDFFSIDQAAIGKGDSTVLVNSTALKAGTSTLNLMAGNYKTTLTLTSVSALPATLVLDYPDPILANSQNTMTVQIFDAKSNPIYAQKDINLKIISSDNDILSFPQNTVIPKGQYYTTFNVRPTMVGTAQVSIIAEDLPLSTYEITVVDTSPKLNLIMPASISNGETFFASITAQDHGDPLKNMKVQWKVNGAIVQNSESMTNQNGTAQIVLLANSPDNIRIDSNVTGLGYAPAHISNVTRIYSNGSSTISSNSTTPNAVQEKLKSFKINGMDPLPIIVLGLIGMGGIIVKKKSIHIFKKK